MNKIIINSNKISYKDIINCFKILIQLNNENKITLHIPKNKNSENKDLDKNFEFRSFISEIYSYKKLHYDQELQKFGFNNIESLLDLNYDMRNRKGYDLLFIDINTGELIIGEVKSAISSTDTKKNYTNTLYSARKSLIDNNSDVKQITLEKIARTNFNIEKIICSTFNDNENLKLNDNAQVNFRTAIKSILEHINNNENEKEANTNLSNLKNISLIIVSWLGIKENESQNFNEKDFRKAFDNIISNMIIPNSHNYILFSFLTKEEYYKLYLEIKKNFDEEKNKWINNL